VIVYRKGQFNQSCTLSRGNPGPGMREPGRCVNFRAR
jgi:hypothetical protein